VVLHIGTSFISSNQAILNLDREVSGLSLEQIHKDGRQEWNKLLSRVSVEGDSHQSHDEVVELKTMLYTSLYRSLLFPRQLGELNEAGKEIHYSPYAEKGGVFEGPSSTDSGFWDVYRTVYPMLHLIYPDLVGRALEGWVNALREDPDGMLVQWSSPGRVGSMVGSMGEVTLAEGIVNGVLRGKSAEDAFAYIKRSALTEAKNGRSYMGDYLKYGYVPEAKKRADTVALTLNYCLSDWAGAQAAKVMGDMETAEILEERSKNWQKIFDDKKQFFRAKETNGRFKPVFDEFAWMGPYTEGGPWQYRFYVPHQPALLRAAYEVAGEAPSGRSQMCEKLLAMMKAPSTAHLRWKIHETVEMQKHAWGQYAHNNQPVHHVLYMMAHAGCPLEGQKWLTHALRSQYGPDGFAGDEDNGEMTSWYILSGIGLYALAPSSGNYQLGAPPLFGSVTVHRPRGFGGDLVIRRGDSLPASKDPLNAFVPARHVEWNGRKIDLTSGAQVISFRELLAGGELVWSA